MTRSGGATKLAMQTKCDVRRAAEILGKSEAAVYQDVARRRIPFRKFGRHVFFFEEELLEFLNSAGGLTLEELQASAR